MNVFDMKKKDFASVRRRNWSEDIGKFRSLVLIPTRRRHDSGYMCMDFVAVDDNGEPICKMGGCSDVVHIGGIKAMVEKQTGGWSIDCLPCGYFRLFHNGEKRNLKAGIDVSDFEIEAV